MGPPTPPCEEALRALTASQGEFLDFLCWAFGSNPAHTIGTTGNP